MRRFHTFLALVAVLSAAIARPASAQDISSPYRFVETTRELAVFAGYMTDAPGRFDFGPRSGPSLGLRFGLGVAGPIEIEADLGYSALTRDVVDPTGAGGPAAIGEADVGQYHILARLQTAITGRRTWNGMQPLFWMGLGLRGDTEGTQTADLAIAEQYRYDTGTKFAATFGGVIRFVFGERWAGRLEAGALLYRLDTPAGYSEEELGFVAVGQDEWVTAPTFGLTFGYRF